MFRANSSSYVSSFRSHDSELDLVDTIDASLTDVTDVRDVMLVRNVQNDDLFPFNASAFLQWFSERPTHPLTREPLEYLRPRVEFKRRCLELLPPQPVGGLAQLDHLAAQFSRLMMQKYVRREALTPPQEVELLECQAYLDVAQCEKAGWIWPLGFVEARALLATKPVGTWLLRTSSQHNLMKNSEVVAMAVNTLDGVKQVRLVHVRAVGWYLTDQDLPATFREMLERLDRKEPDLVTWAHVMEYFATYKVHWNLMLLREPDVPEAVE